MSENVSSIPHAARIYDYLIGGDDYTPADQAAAGAMTGLLPSLPKWLPMLRDYLPRMAATLYEQGFRHFVDFASGLPHRHLHSALGDDVRIVYSDIDPEIVARGRRFCAAARTPATWPPTSPVRWTCSTIRPPRISSAARTGWRSG